MNKSYDQTITWLFQQLPLYQRQGKTAFKKDLTNIKAFSAKLRHPEKDFKSVHVAGTNGKGSVCHMLASVFQAAGYKTGLYTSPHLKDFRERIRIDGKPIPKSFITTFIGARQSFLENQKLSFFEMTVGMAFAYFAREKVDIAIIETGMGGRLDSTNILNPILSVITNIGFDHTKFLGNTLPEIAFEKAGIIKPDTPVVIGERNPGTTPVFTQKAKAVKAPLYFAEDDPPALLPCDLKGFYQKRNQVTARKALAILQEMGWRFTEDRLAKGFSHIQQTTGLRGRWQQLGENPLTFCDTGHNKEGLELVLQQLQQQSYRNLHIILGVVNDKDLSAILPLFPHTATYYFCCPDVPRGLPAITLKETAAGFHLKGTAFSTVKKAFKTAQARSDKEDLIFVGGSTFTVAEVL